MSSPINVMIPLEAPHVHEPEIHILANSVGVRLDEWLFREWLGIATLLVVSRCLVWRLRGGLVTHGITLANEAS